MRSRHLTAQQRSRLTAPPLSYLEVGATVAELPAGYDHLAVERHLGVGRDRFHTAVNRLMTWEMHRRAGLQVDPDAHRVAIGQVAVLTLVWGPVRIGAPVRVVEVVDEPTVRGFAYGTLPGHPESGEERFLVHLEADDTVRASIRAFSRPARWYSAIGAPLARRLQDRTTTRYLDALGAAS